MSHCIDYSIAENGWLVAYSKSGEKKLNPRHFTIAYGDVGFFKQLFYVGCNRGIEGIRSV